MTRKFNGQVVLEWILISSLAVLVLGGVVYGVARGAGTTSNRASAVMGGMGQMGEPGYSPYDTVMPSGTLAVTSTLTLTPTGTFQATGIYVDPIDIPGLTDTITPLPTATETLTITPTFTATLTRTPTLTSTPTETFTPTLTETLTPTEILTYTPTFTPTDTAMPTATPLPDPSVVAFAGPYANSSQTFGIPANANLVIVIEAGADHACPSAMTLGGVAMTRYAYVDSGIREFWSYYILPGVKGLSPGIQTLSITRGCSGSGDYGYEIYAIANAITTASPFRTSTTVTGAPGLNSFYMTLSTQPGDLIIAAAGTSTPGTFTDATSLSTAGTNSNFVTGYKTATGTSTSIGWFVSWDTPGAGSYGALVVKT